MKKDKKIVIIFLISILLHLIAYLLWLYIKPDEAIVPSGKTITVNLSSSKQDIKKEELETLEKPLEEPEPEPELEPELSATEQMMPVDTADKFSSNNQNDQSQTNIVFGQESAEKMGEQLLKQEAASQEKNKETAIQNKKALSNLKEQAETSKTLTKFDKKIERKSISSTENSGVVLPKKQLIESENNLDSDGDSNDIASSVSPTYYDYFSGILEQEGELFSEAEIVNDVAYAPGNIALLADGEMSEVVVEQPFSDLESKELRLANEFLDRMNKQVLAVWENPYKGQHLYRGVVKLELDENGYLQDVYIYKASGHPVLDSSVINSIRAVVQFHVPENKILANRYYTNLRFYYSSIENKTELMPFQKETEKEK
jgi:outer membrane biosynthesis protein TonB